MLICLIIELVSVLKSKTIASIFAEASGQNFSGEEEEKGRNSEVCRKRRREANFDDSSLNDQVNIEDKKKTHTQQLHLCFAKEVTGYSQVVP